MDPRITKTFSDTLMLGGVVVATGSVAGLWLPPGIALLILAIVLCRICWIEDNIHHDLLPATRMPPSYSRRGWLNVGAGPDRTQAGTPRQLAAEMRLQAHAWGAFAWGTAGGLLLQGTVPLTIVVGAVALVLALRQADYLALGSATLAGGSDLPERLIAGRGALSQIGVIRRGPD